MQHRIICPRCDGKFSVPVALVAEQIGKPIEFDTIQCPHCKHRMFFYLAGACTVDKYWFGDAARVTADNHWD